MHMSCPIQPHLTPHPAVSCIARPTVAPSLQSLARGCAQSPPTPPAASSLSHQHRRLAPNHTSTRLGWLAPRASLTLPSPRAQGAHGRACTHAFEVLAGAVGATPAMHPVPPHSCRLLSQQRCGDSLYRPSTRHPVPKHGAMCVQKLDDSRACLQFPSRIAVCCVLHRRGSLEIHWWQLCVCCLIVCCWKYVPSARPNLYLSWLGAGGRWFGAAALMLLHSHHPQPRTLNQPAPSPITPAGFIGQALLSPATLTPKS